jgi:hypothetical protein
MDPGARTSAHNFSSDTNFSKIDNIHKVALGDKLLTVLNEYW